MNASGIEHHIVAADHLVRFPAVSLRLFVERQKWGVGPSALYVPHMFGTHLPLTCQVDSRRDQIAAVIPPRIILQIETLSD